MEKYEDIDFINALENQFKIVEDNTYEQLVHFQNTSNNAVQRWYPYREGYSYKLVSRIISEYKIKGPILDPFSGSGSSILAARLEGLTAVGIDVNPIAVFVGRTENHSYNKNDILAIEKYLNDFEHIKQDDVHRSTNYNLAEKYFNFDILQTLLQLRDFIDQQITEKTLHDVFYLAWLSVIENVSNVKKEGNGVKHRNRVRRKNGYETIPLNQWENENFPSDKFSFVLDKISSNVSMMLDDIKKMSYVSAPKAEFYQGNSIDIVKNISENFELTIFSPPYVNFFDYFEIHKTELWLGQFVNSSQELRKLKQTGLRSNAGASASKTISYNNLSVEHIVRQLETKKLWSNRIPPVVAGYFDDMHALLQNIYNKTVDGGTVAIVIGNSAYAGILIPSDLLVAEIGEFVGFSVEQIIVTRHLTTSPQQRKVLNSVMHYMRESIIILRKV
ncbi:site-specific DNA-methyltransferase [Leuconostoc citreum]